MTGIPLSARRSSVPLTGKFLLANDMVRPDGIRRPLMLAPRLATEVLVTNDLSDQDQLALIQSLVPIAARDTTTLDTVLARLLLAGRKLVSEDILQELEKDLN